MRHMRPTFAALALAAALPVTAFAADPLGDTVAFSAEPAVNWAGSYAGVTLGWTLANLDITQTGVGSGDIELTGGSIGLVSGRNFKLGSVIVGLEGDFTIHEAKGSNRSGAFVPSSSDLLWSSTIRGRLGYPVGRFLPFVTGGIAFGELDSHSTALVIDGDNERLVGWTAGAGLDVAVTPSVVARIEYAFQDFGSERFTYAVTGATTTQDLHSHTVRVAAIAQATGMGGGWKLARDVTPDYWAGFTAGRYVGFATGTVDATVQGGANAGAQADYTIDGIFNGNSVGFDMVYGRVLVGLEAELGRSGAEGSTTTGLVPAHETSFFWQGGVKARLGYAIDRFLPYVTAGYAIGQYEVESRNPAAPGQNVVPLKAGFSLGAGAEVAVTRAIAARLQYDYVSFSDTTANFGAPPVSLESDTHQFRLGIVARLKN